VAIYCNEAVRDSGIDWENVDRSRVGIYLGVTEHGNVETENEIYEIKGYDYDTSYWSHHHNPRTVANNPAGEVALNMSIWGPHYTIGAACAAGNAGSSRGLKCSDSVNATWLWPGESRRASTRSASFASFRSQGALAEHDDPTKASRPFDLQRNGIVVAEGGCVYVLERLDDARRRGARIYAELLGYAMNTDATDFVLPNPQRQAECLQLALQRAGLPAGGDRYRQYSRHRNHLGRHPRMYRPASSLRKVGQDHFNNTKELHGSLHGGRRSARAGGKSPGL
jgi:3-oxoacyl-[acyl-carrier-protein] synthase II